MPKPEYNDFLFQCIATSELLDASGEKVILAGADCSDFYDGKAWINFEHDGQKTPLNLVGKIIYAKKIFKEEDCETEQQLNFFNKINKIPYLYVIGRLFTSAGHPGAISLAAIMRDQELNAGKTSDNLKVSVEGSTLERKDNVLVRSVLRKLAITQGSCNKTCHISVLNDPDAPEGYNKEPNKEKSKDILEFLDNKKSEGQDFRLGTHSDLQFKSFSKNGPMIRQLLKSLVILKLKKALSAGSTAGAPGTLTQGSALQKEVNIKGLRSKALKFYKDYKTSNPRSFIKTDFYKYLKHKMPDASDEFIAHFTDLADKIRAPKLTKTFERNLEGLLIDIRTLTKATQNLMPDCVYSLYVKKPNDKGELSNFCVGRFTVKNDCLYHLEDYFDYLKELLPEGAVTPEVIERICELENNNNFKIEEFHKEVSPEVSSSVTPEESTPFNGRSFFYQRHGMPDNHLIEINGETFTLDGNKLDEEEVKRIHHNVKNGLATLRYTQSPSLQKSESTEEDVLIDPHTGIGNEHALSSMKKYPGSWIACSINSFNHLHQNQGYDAAQASIKLLAKTLMETIDFYKLQEIKIFREANKIVIYSMNPESAFLLLRALHTKLNDAVPVGGTHKLSLVAGIATSYINATKAMLEAKKQKQEITGELKYHPESTPHLTHSYLNQDRLPPK